MIIHVKVRPNSREERIERISKNEYLISVKESAENNKANAGVINFLSKELGVSFRKIVIKNPKSRNKIVEIEER